MFLTTQGSWPRKQPSKHEEETQVTVAVELEAFFLCGLPLASLQAWGLKLLRQRVELLNRCNRKTTSANSLETSNLLVYPWCYMCLCTVAFIARRTCEFVKPRMRGVGTFQVWNTTKEFCRVRIICVRQAGITHVCKCVDRKQFLMFCVCVCVCWAYEHDERNCNCRPPVRF